MLIPNYTVDDLKKLPLRAITAFAVRCARRVADLAVLPDGHPQNENLRSAVNEALELAEGFVRGQPCASCLPVVRRIAAMEQLADSDFVREQAIASVARAAHTAATALHALGLEREPDGMHSMDPIGNEAGALNHLARLSAEMAALDAMTAAVDASDAVGYADAFIKSATSDYERLVRLDLGRYPLAGAPIDLSAEGPLGPLWAELPPR